MKYFVFIVLFMIHSMPLLAQERRDMGAHEHGVGHLNIAFEGNRIMMELETPGADIVGFEYIAKSDEDRMAIENAIEALSQPLNLFRLPGAADCSVVYARASLVEDMQEEHEEEHEEEEEHGENGEHEEQESAHTEFHAEYELNCTNPSGLTRIDFTYFSKFPNARELEVQVVSDKGAQAFEIERDEPVLDLKDRI